MISSINNLDLLVVGIIVSAIIVLGFVVYYSDKKSITNRSFLLFSLVTALWGIVNYFSYKFTDPIILLWLFRFILFFAIFQVFYLHRFLLVYPSKNYTFTNKYNYLLVPLVLITSALTLSPFVFSSIIGQPAINQVAKVTKGFGLIIFALVAIGLVIRAFYILILKIRNNGNLKIRKSLKLILLGLILMFVLIIFFNLIMATIFSNPRFVPLGALFVFPFIAFTSYAVIKRKLFNVKVMATAILIFILSIVLFLEIIFSSTIILVIFRSSIFVLFLIFGIYLINNVVKEIKQREKLEQLKIELESANEKLKSLDKLKTEFVSLASHQLRSPLTAMKGYISMVIEGDYGKINPKAMQIMNRVFESSQNLTKIVEDLLDVSKIEQGGMKYEMSPFNLVSIAKNTAKDLSITAKNKGLKLNFNSSNEESIMVNGDKEKIRQVIINFIDNSIKYTKEGEINIGVKKLGDKAIFFVKDTGVGMTEAIKENLFQKFSRGDGAKMNTTGSGLGLYLAKEIVKAHNGRVWVESGGLGKGSTFYIELTLLK